MVVGVVVVDVVVADWPTSLNVEKKDAESRSNYADYDLKNYNWGLAPVILSVQQGESGQEFTLIKREGESVLLFLIFVN